MQKQGIKTNYYVYTHLKISYGIEVYGQATVMQNPSTWNVDPEKREIKGKYIFSKFFPIFIPQKLVKVMPLQ